MKQNTNDRMSVWRVLNRVVLVLCACVVMGGSFGFAQDDDQSVQLPKKARVRGSIPAVRQADRIAVITMKGAIDSVTAHSIIRRIKAAEVGGFDGMVIEIDSPGGELGAVQEISSAIKESTIINSVAWVHPDAYSGGAIVALACQEIVHSRPASMGDAFVINVDLTGRTGIQALSPTERTKFLPPLLADLTDSARRSGFDEYLVQAIVVDGIELWMVVDSETGERMSINEEEYRLLFGDDVMRGKPMLDSVTGGVQTYYDREELNDDSEQNLDEEQSDENEEQDEVDVGVVQDREGVSEDEEDDQEVERDPNAFEAASPTLWDVEEAMMTRGEDETDQVVGLGIPSNRRVLTREDAGQFELVGYITDGTSAIVMRDEQLDYFGFSSGTINTDDELLEFFGAQTMVRAKMSGSEHAIRFLTSMGVRYLLIAVFLIAAFAEMITAGTGIAGSVSLAALLLLVVPGAMIGLTGWWVLIAILAGIVCLMVEVFVTPGLGLFGVLGLLLVIGGLIGVFVNANSGMSDPMVQRDMTRGAMTVMLSLITAGIGCWLAFRWLNGSEWIDRLIPSGVSGIGAIPEKSLLHAIVEDDGSVRVGDLGRTTTPLRPIGQAEFEGEICDVFSTGEYIESSSEIRVVKVTKHQVNVGAIKIEVELALEDSIEEEEV